MWTQTSPTGPIVINKKRHSAELTINPTLIDHIVKKKKYKPLLFEHCFQLHIQWKIILPGVRQDVSTLTSSEDGQS